ncbi:MAG TPA: hypothetical protein VMA09_01215 [Candidatus Binataceae bacterium]|nr:hypothetical protein [Candidatus Binataceae bacterium]
MGASEEKTRAATSQLDPARKAAVFTDVLRQFGSGQKVDPADWADFVRAQNEGLVTGPEAGQRVPDFELADQNGRSWKLNDLMGANGLLLVFTRSADW